MSLGDDESRPAKFSIVVPDELRWRKSSLSGGSGNCVEFADAGDLVLVRDSEDPSGPHLRFTSSQWRCFLAGVRLGEFDK